MSLPRRRHNWLLLLLKGTYGQKSPHQLSPYRAEECFIVRSPEYASENQISYIDQYVQSVENAILSPDGIDPGSGKSYMDLIDVDSFDRVENQTEESLWAASFVSLSGEVET